MIIARRAVVKVVCLTVPVPVAVAVSFTFVTVAVTVVAVRRRGELMLSTTAAMTRGWRAEMASRTKIQADGWSMGVRRARHVWSEDLASFPQDTRPAERLCAPFSERRWLLYSPRYYVTRVCK